MMNKEEKIEYYTFQYRIPVYKNKPPQTFCEYYELHKDEIIVELDKENKDLQARIDKAKEYIENRTYSSVATMKTVLNLQNDELYDLLEILGGKE